jgi:hypothetical protein
MIEAPDGVGVDYAELVERALTDFDFYCETCLRVPRRQDLRPVPLVMKPAQRRLAKHMIQCLIDGVPIRVIILKARRHGMSTIIQAFFFWMCSTRPYQHSLTIAHDQTTTKTIHKMTENFYRVVPRWIKPMADTATRGTMLEFQNPTKREQDREKDPGLESSMQTTSLDNAGAGSGILWLHLSEVARDTWQTDKGQEAMKTALQTVPREPNTAVFKESTAQGAGNSFHQDWLDAENGDSDYLAFFAPWWEEPTYTDKPPKDFERTPEEDETAETARTSPHCPAELTDGQLWWRRLQIKNELQGKIDWFNEEYPATPRLAFLTSGRPFFNQEAIERHAKQADQTKPLHIGDILTRLRKDGSHAARFEANRYGALRIWEEPIPQKDYLIFADCAAGTGEQGDYQAAYVMRRDEMIIVASWHGLVDRDLFADALYNVGYVYNKALIAVEVSGGWGTSVVTSLRVREHAYPNLYRRRPHGDRKTRQRQQAYGWETTAKTRADMLDSLEQALREDDIVVNDPRLLEECRTFTYTNLKPQAQQGCHDDRVIAAAGAAYLYLHERRPTIQNDQSLVGPWEPRSVVAGY